MSVSYPAGRYAIEVFSAGEVRLWYQPPERQHVTLPQSLRSALIAIAVRNPDADGRPRDHGRWTLEWSGSPRVRNALGGLGYDEWTELIARAAQAHDVNPEDLAAVMLRLTELRARTGEES